MEVSAGAQRRAASVPTCIVLHAWWGLTEDARVYADRLRGEGYAVATPDLYGNGQVASTIAEAKALLAGRDLDAARTRVDAAVDELARQARPAVVGWSMGAAFGWDLVIRRPGLVRRLIAYYGGLDDVEGLTECPPTLSHVGGADDSPSPADARELHQKMAARGFPFRFHVYDGARHWFDESSRPEYDAAASALAWQRTLDFLRQAP